VWEHALCYRCRKASKLGKFVPSRDRHGKKKVEIACWNFDGLVKVVTPLKNGVQLFCKPTIILAYEMNNSRTYEHLIFGIYGCAAPCPIKASGYFDCHERN
jgi:hypothetical protein